MLTMLSCVRFHLRRPSVAVRPVPNPPRCESGGFRYETGTFVFRYTGVESLDVKCARLLKGVAGVALGISIGLRLEATIASVVHSVQGDLPVWIFRPTSDRPGIDAENLSDRVDVS